MLLRTLMLPLTLFAAACAGDKDTGGLPVGTPPDVAGHYNVIVAAATGCGEQGEDWFQPWLEGPLKVDGADGDLTYDFGDDFIFDGNVTASRAFSFAGLVEYNGATLDAYGSGTFSSETYETSDGGEGSRWILDGDFEAEVDDDEFDTNNCTVEGPFQGTQL